MSVFQKLEFNWDKMNNSDCPLDSKQLTFNSPVSPQEARDLAEVNYNGNRDLHNLTFRRYVRAMNLNRWNLSPEPLVFTKHSGLWVLINGHHRINAQIETNKTVPYAVSVVKELEVFRILDQGKTRGIHEILNMVRAVTLPISYLYRSATFVLNPTHEDVAKLLDTEIGELLIEVDQQIKPPKSSRNPWKSPAFRSAYVMSVAMGLIDHSKAYELYDTISHSNIKKWPDVFASMHRQIMERTIGIDTSGRSLDNTNFMRGLYAFANHDQECEHMSVHPSFRSKSKEQVQDYMKQYTTTELREVT